mgnify:CR=1 FL=1
MFAVAPLALIRGRTLAYASVRLDEAQNTTPMQMKMFLTRLGEGSRMVVTGDMTQVDLPDGTKSGLRDALETIGDVKGVATLKVAQRDIVRHHLVTKIVQAYDAADELRDRLKKGYRGNKDDASKDTDNDGTA